ncbi:MAG: nicotinate-nucleotide adenylyltransferase [Bacteroidetes bacterium]|nr:nicotinate-nucleotide adenylyltransferase [Bacteroidota bacterium]
MKVGLFFGSFNPIHTGHLIIAGIMVETTDIDKVWFVVSPQNPLKRSKSLLHEFDRLDMVRAAIYDNYNLEVSDVEFRMPKPSYTIDTMTYLAEKHPDKRFVLIIGEDNLKTFPKWKNHNIIIENFEVYVYPRPKSVDSDLKTHPKVRMVEAPMIDISATFIRKCIKQNRSVKYLVPDSVEAMIRSKKFYQN